MWLRSPDLRHSLVPGIIDALIFIVCAPGVPVFLLRMLAVKNSQKRSEAFGSDRNSTGDLAVMFAQIAGSFEGDQLSILGHSDHE